MARRRPALAALLRERDAAKRAWEAAKRSGERGASRPYYVALRTVEEKISALLTGA